MDSKKMMQTIIDKATNAIMERIQASVREEVADLVESMAKATIDVFSSCQCAGKCGETPATEPEDDGEPVGVEVHTHGLKLDANDRLRFSKMVCEFLSSLDGDEDGDPQDPAAAAEEPKEEDSETLIEAVTIKIGKDGKATFERKVVEAPDRSDK